MRSSLSQPLPLLWAGTPWERVTACLAAQAVAKKKEIQRRIGKPVVTDSYEDVSARWALLPELLALKVKRNLSWSWAEAALRGWCSLSWLVTSAFGS